MPLVAREVLEDCRGALSDFREGIQGNQWRRHWILCITLLRMVLHVLKKVDGEEKGDRVLKKIIGDKWNESNKEPIFLNFIDKTRNSILKEYKTMAGQGARAAVYNRNTPHTDKGESTYKINEGYYKGKDQREVIQEAIEWLDQYLTDVEERYKQKTGNDI